MKKILPILVFVAISLSSFSCRDQDDDLFDYTCTCTVQDSTTSFIYLSFGQVEAEMACADNEAELQLDFPDATCELEELEN